MAQWDAEDKTFLITGGASGLGAEYTRTFLELGAKNVAIVDIAEEVGKATAERLNKVHGNKVVFLKCDVSKEDDIQSVFDSVVAQFKQIDVIINNAGIMNDSPAMWRTACDVNWQGLVSFTLKGIKHMQKDEGGAGGTIVNISSTAALNNKLPFVPIYSGSKMAVLHFCQSLAAEPFFEMKGVRILTICFGPTDTTMMHKLESRSYDPKLGEIFATSIAARGVKYQKVESAVAAFVEIFKYGAPGSIWLSTQNKPAKEITPVIINRAFEEIAKVF